jgi:hypothetical protein
MKTWGDRTFVDLAWQGPKMFSKERTPSTIPAYKGVYLLSSRHNMYDYPRGRSSLAYVGSGLVADRLPDHVSTNPRVQQTLNEEGTLWFWYARVGYEAHDCVERALFDEFEARHGSGPVLNVIRPSCRVDHSSIVVRHQRIHFPFDFSSPSFP